MHQDVETVGILSACVCVCVKLGAHTGTAETISAAEEATITGNSPTQSASLPASGNSSMHSTYDTHGSTQLR